jgi:D-sedoheptulose 7-phosphate isomerase
MNYLTENYEELRQCVADFHACLQVVNETAELILERLLAGATVFACGNGGSATDSMHLCEELVGRYRADRPSLPAISLNADNSALTCIGNDYGFEEVFSRQLAGLGKGG